MKYFSSLLFAFLLGFGHLLAQPATEAAAVSHAPTAAENALLWRISGKDLVTTSYLYGTIHMIGKEDFFLTDSTRSAIDRAKLVTFEINMEDMMNLSAQIGLMMKSFMSGGQTLSDLLSKEDYALVKAHFDKQGLPIFLFERMKPMFLTVLADADLSGGLGGDGDMVSYEMKIMDIAQQQKKKMGGLETAEYQMSMFDSIPYQEQAEMLVESIKSTGTENGQFDDMVKLYKAQDIVGMVSMMGEDESIGGHQDLLLNQRNRNWIPIMGEMMLAQPSFFAVGAGHLGGESGVVSLLRNAGYTVEAVR
ncbi:MAG: TraB/GumN family protein [Saprospiraceae bacterium]|nr:TraB/GumN family protein [Saprospiraceae bacterium]MCF8250865.1 TraB/GumN family protein [Saprospiraceae bacterium]MCF8312734.1 TraB/GumN family protein [Saprospiraceae bacterium]MCF8441181.1 TraB/GumN family protein [Saprospiraceae bacterium]